MFKRLIFSNNQKVEINILGKHETNISVIALISIIGIVGYEIKVCACFGEIFKFTIER